MLELIFIWAEARMKDIKMFSRAIERERWTLREARKFISDEDWQRLMIQREVARMDPDFQFADANESIKKPHSLAEALARTGR